MNSSQHAEFVRKTYLNGISLVDQIEATLQELWDKSSTEYKMNLSYLINILERQDPVLGMFASLTWERLMLNDRIFHECRDDELSGNS